MKRLPLTTPAFASLLLLSASTTTVIATQAEDEAPHATAQAPAQKSVQQTSQQNIKATVAALPAPLPFKPGMDDLMTMLVTPRHLRLFYAGQARNWELAAFEVRELRKAMQRIASVMPVYLERDVKETVGAMLDPRLAAAEAAIAAANPAKFSTAYEDITAACNACHTYLEHSFLVIKTPTASADVALPNQHFEPAP